MLTEGADAGIVLSLVTVAAAVACSILLQDLVVLGVAAAGALFTVPVAMGRWFPDSLAAAVALVVVGLALIGIAARRADAAEKSRQLHELRDVLAELRASLEEDR
jgi:hypothetical protein